MRKKFTSLQKEISDLREEIEQLNVEKGKLNVIIKNLEKDKAGQKKEIAERDETIQDKASDVMLLSAVLNCDLHCE